MILQGRDLKQDLTGDDVRLLHSELAELDLLAPPDEQQRGFFGSNTRELVMKFQKDHGIQTTGVVDAATATAINREVAARTADKFLVSGRVYSAQRAGLAGLRVAVVDKNAGPDVSLAEGVFGTDDRYAIEYMVTKLRQGGKATPDIQVRVFSGDKFLGASEVRYNASPLEVLDVFLPDSVSASLPSEHETLAAAIGVHYKGQLRDLQESNDRSDVTYLANKTGWDARAVALAALADQFGERSGAAKVPPVYFYALFRAGLPANEDILYHADSKTLATVLTKASEEGVIPQAAARDIPGVVQKFQTLSAQKLLSTPALPGTSSMKDILAISRLTDAQQQEFAELYSANRKDLPTFWEAAARAFGPDVAKRLETSGKLAFLTVNNAPLVAALTPLGDPLKLVQSGFHRAAKWGDLLTDRVPIPPQMPGKTVDEKRTNYATFLSAQLRLSYPTAAIAEMVKNGDLPVAAADRVEAFLTAHQGKFELGVQPVGQYIARNNLQVDKETVNQIQRLQRVQQITTSDQAMTVLMKQGMDAAYHVVQFDRDAFADKFAEPLGGTMAAYKLYDKSVRIHGAVLSIAVSYITARNGIKLGTTPMAAGPNNGGQVIQPAPKKPAPENAVDIIAYPTLESLFGSMDFCACDECRSILSPAAYLVDLLQFIDKAADGKQNAQTVLLERRPDIQYLPLTCENTNTAMPYIDLVNETLEYYIANATQHLSLKNFQGHDTGTAVSEDLLATPQFVMDAAYTTLQAEWFPSPLPFHQPLENLRRYFKKFEVPLQSAMESLRQTEALERGGSVYGWRDILMEELGLSRQEYRLLTDSALSLKQIYGFAAGKTDAEVSDTLSNAKQFARRVGISYDDLVSILRTHFINPNSNLIPKLERLGVGFGAIQALHDNTMSGADFLKLLPTGAGAPDPAEYKGDIVAWLKDPANFARIMGIITLADPTNSVEGCNFDKFELRYSKPVANAADKTTRLTTPDFYRLLRFIRLWLKTGWTIEQTDAAICSLYRVDLKPVEPGDVSTLANLDSGFKALLPRLGIVIRVMNSLELNSKRDLLPLLACWSDISTHGTTALYRQLFLAPTVLSQDVAFGDNGYGEFLTNAVETLSAHAEVIRGAFNLTGDEWDRIFKALAFDNATKLNLANISAIYRRGWLARKLRLSVREFLLLTSLPGLDPFATPDIAVQPVGPPPIPAEPAVRQLIALVQALKARSLKSAVALFVIWNQDLSGKSAPDPAQVTEFGRTLRGDYASIEDQFAATEDPGGDILRARMTLVYGEEAAGAFSALLDNTLAPDVAYTHPAPALEAAITAVDSHLAYDSFRHRLSHTGILSAPVAAALKALVIVTADFRDAVDALLALSKDAQDSFFSRYPELKPLYDTYTASVDPIEQRRTALLKAFQPELSRRRKREQALQRLSTAATLDLDSTRILLDPTVSPGATFPLHAAADVARPVLDDVLALETPGLKVDFYFRDTATGLIDQRVIAAASLDYSVSSGNPLPANPIPGAAISGIWSGSIEIPETGYYNIVIEADAQAGVKLSLAGQAQPLIRNGNVWRNSNPLQLNGGTLSDVALTVEKVKAALRVSWETPKRPREVIPGRYLYPPSTLPPFHDAYVRFLKAASLASGLRLTAGEIAHLATDPAYRINGDGWLNALPVSGDPALALAKSLLVPFTALLDFARIKAQISPDDESLLKILNDPAAATAHSDSLLFTLTQWDPASLNNVLARFGSNIAGLAIFRTFQRVYDAFTPIQQMGVAAGKLIPATTNDPLPAAVRGLQAALRARYEASDWRDIIQPINDAMRSLQRDALVSYILHQLGEDPASAHIDTADKLFEYFLMDVKMEPCMQTSRIRNALSSVQLFVDRCLLNLETNVSPKSINAAYWVWMKRYRVWEANRKVFLFPENWLEPELRDDKSPFFKEIESQLLQSDITDDTAEEALLTYLSKLLDVANLEPVGMYFEEHDAGDEDDIVHTIARTSGAHRNYYYRRYELGYWTPWEQIKLDIEENPVIPVRWNNRLLLFWLKILKQTPQAQPAAPDPPANEKNLAGQTLTSLKSDAKFRADTNVKVTVQAVLYWSEYYNGKWQAAKTSDLNDPAVLGEFPPAGSNAFVRSKLQLRSDEPQDGQLRITIYGAGTARAFVLYNTHSLPELRNTASAGTPFGKKRSFDKGATFSIGYDKKIPDIPPYSLDRPVLTRDTTISIVQPNHYVDNMWHAPFFFEDRKHIFYVTTEESQGWVRDPPSFGVPIDPGFVEVPPLVLIPIPTPGPKFWGDGGPIGPDVRVVDPSPMQRLVTEDAYIRRGLGNTASVSYGDREIGPHGAIVTPIAERG
jgi:hypothetical protein